MTKEEIEKTRRPVKTFEDGSSIGFVHGLFDDWCVYRYDRNGYESRPRDFSYFNTLKEMGKKYGNERVYDDAMKVYDMVDKNASDPETRNKRDAEIKKNPSDEENIRKKYDVQWKDDALNKIHDIAQTYEPKDVLRMEQTLTTVYMGMIAEENNAHALIGKDMKALALYQIMLEEMPVWDAVNFSKGKSAKDDLDPMCKERFRHRSAALKELNRNNVYFKDIPIVGPKDDVQADVCQSICQKDSDTFCILCEYNGGQYALMIPKNSAEYIINEKHDAPSDRWMLDVQMPSETTFHRLYQKNEARTDADLLALSAGELYLYEHDINVQLPPGPVDEKASKEDRGLQAESQLAVNDDEKSEENNGKEP